MKCKSSPRWSGVAVLSFVVLAGCQAGYAPSEEAPGWKDDETASRESRVRREIEARELSPVAAELETRLALTPAGKTLALSIRTHGGWDAWLAAAGFSYVRTRTLRAPELAEWIPDPGARLVSLVLGTRARGSIVGVDAEVEDTSAALVPAIDDVRPAAAVSVSADDEATPGGASMTGGAGASAPGGAGADVPAGVSVPATVPAAAGTAVAPHAGAADADEGADVVTERVGPEAQPADSVPVSDPMSAGLPLDPQGVVTVGEGAIIVGDILEWLFLGVPFIYVEEARRQESLGAETDARTGEVFFRVRYSRGDAVDAPWVTVWFDRSTWAVHRMSVPLQGKKVLLVLFSKWKEVTGIQVPTERAMFLLDHAYDRWDPAKPDAQDRLTDL